MSQHDRWLAAYSTHLTDAYCVNAKCDDYGVALTVRFETEYGQGWITPEECRTCGGDLSLEVPEPVEEADDD
jgi:hypothetical protein